MTDAVRPSSAALRASITREWVVPLARAMLEAEPRAASVLFLVGQFWADEAEDAVHGELLACPDANPRWPAVASRAANPLGEAEPRFLDESAPPDFPPDDAFFAQEAIQRRAYEAVRAQGIETPDDNGEMIVAFASYCEGDASQDDPRTLAFHPYCLVRRDSDEPEILGTQRRPEWEDRWDVVDAGGSLRELGLSPEERAASAARPAHRPRHTMPPWLWILGLLALAASAYRLLFGG